MYMEKFSLQGQVGVVTGGGQGLGRVYCHAFAEAGADVVIAELNPDTGEQVAKQVRAMGRRALAVTTDVRNKSSVDAMATVALKEFGQIDFLMNNAGLARLYDAADIPEDEWKDIFDVNLNGMLFCCQAVGRHMIERRRGSIVNISSVSGLVANRHRPHISYNVSKAGVKHLTTMLACEWAPHNIRVNGIAPGYIATEHAKDFLADPQYGGQFIPWIPMQRPGQPEELGPLAIFLASDASSYLTGATIVADGGYTCW